MMTRRELLKLAGMTSLAPFSGLLPAAEAGRDAATEAGTQLLVYGATPGGITCCIRAAREGLKVTLVSAAGHLGGMLVNGLGVMDTLYNGARAPLYDEFRKAIYNYYRLKYGTNSPQYKSSGPGISKTMYEARVAEQLIREWLQAEPNITVRKRYYPLSAKKAGGRLQQVVFRSMDGAQDLILSASVFADCSYEGDLLAISGSDFIIGRESKNEYGENFAGVVYAKDEQPAADVSETAREQQELIRNLNLFRYEERRTVLMMPESTGEADKTVQGYNLRTILTDDPDNRYWPERPANYDAEHFRKHYTHKAEDLTLSRPNRKSSLSYPEITGLQNKYVEGDWIERRRIIQQYKDEVNGLLYFRQHDPSLSEAIRDHWRKYGLAKDEFPDNDHIPYEIYVREARRIRGKQVFTEHDAQLAPGLKRAPIHTDSIITTEWFLDSHACTEGRVRGSRKEGEVMLKSETVPGQVPLAVLFPSQPSNLIVPVCVSASHIGWGAIRLEPVWMSIGEAAGYLAAEACYGKIDPPAVGTDAFIRKLATHRFMLSFFNDVEGRESASWYPAVQYLGTKGFFGSYESGADQKMTKALAERWADHLRHWKQTGDWDANAQARQTAKLEMLPGDPLHAEAFAVLVGKALELPGKASQWLRQLPLPATAILSRGDAARIIFEAITNCRLCDHH
jgi:hypothetical protein